MTLDRSNTSRTTILFGYGTLRRDDWRAAILGAAYPAQPAKLTGWRRTVTRSGYLSIARDAQSHVDGVAIALDAIGWTIADAWEEVPRYERVRVDVTSALGSLDAETYVSTEPVTLSEIEEHRFAWLDDVSVEDAIARFASDMRALRARNGDPP
jgi:gamma-glutamylcyclotransferase (GGCT)/AIG2-like uncharacterized protein YtfP